MTRTLTITAAEWASVHDGTLWLVREASLSFTRVRGGSPVVMEGTYGPPVEFVQACAPCETCHGIRRSSEWDVYDMRHDVPCPDCRIELVGPCPRCTDGTDRTRIYHAPCRVCGGKGSVTLGHAYAVGRPLPITGDGIWPHLGDHIIIDNDGEVFPLIDGVFDDQITDRLAHYGPPESLVGKWALQLAVQP